MARVPSSNHSIVIVGQLPGSGNPILVFVALIIMLYSIALDYDAASYFRDYDSHTFGIAVTIAKILIASVGPGLLAFIVMIVAPITGLAAILSFASIALGIIGNLGHGYFIYPLGEVYELGYPVPKELIHYSSSGLDNWILHWCGGFDLSRGSLLDIQEGDNVAGFSIKHGILTIFSKIERIYRHDKR